MDNLSDSDILEIRLMFRSRGWELYKQFVANQSERLLNEVSGHSGELADLFLHQQNLGALKFSRNIVENFKLTLEK